MYEKHVCSRCSDCQFYHFFFMFIFSYKCIFIRRSKISCGWCVDQGGNASCVNKEGKPALHMAVLAHHADVILVLVQAGADVNRKGPNHGNTALHEAVDTSSVNDDVIDALLGWGTKICTKRSGLLCADMVYRRTRSFCCRNGGTLCICEIQMSQKCQTATYKCVSKLHCKQKLSCSRDSARTLMGPIVTSISLFLYWCQHIEASILDTWHLRHFKFWQYRHIFFSENYVLKICIILFLNC